MSRKKLKLLLIIEQCNPEKSSVPLEGYNYFHEINQLFDATLVTHERNQKALEKLGYKNIVYMLESDLNKKYHRLVSHVTTIRGKRNWPLYNALRYPIYAEFNQKVYQQFKQQILQGEYDIVHALTPMMPRYPVKAVKLCQKTPFIIGPVNGGVPFPAGFEEIAKQEFAQFNFLRTLGRYLIPGYVETYKKADRVLAGSTYTLNNLKEMFSLSDDRISLFYENGITSNFLETEKSLTPKEKVHLLFVGRLVPYKGADMVMEALGRLEPSLQNKIIFTIVGDGSEKRFLEQKSQELGLTHLVNFAGWVTQQQTLEYYQNSDIFCFPSIREFGGAVVLEAMACGLPCIVVNNGGIGEYVTEETGFKIEPKSKDHLILELVNCIKVLVEDDSLRNEMSWKSRERVREFTWQNKAQAIAQIYEEILKK
ncbi:MULTISPECIES: glycosyltransferase family 4 protein [Planktothricoides]|uniref:Glycosyltransferase family 4 protein n=1 Tax=Planktothricoides raciborskii GIHE-MW2 TaxID=2792601 RepID=A0AAU8JDE2_9CYAN|nr:glycosyltransferase family 4 protein [Planktothricoides sp. SR001]KOR35914.1 glycosyl transferase family 1 [Planktothricoides sp. SR001]